MSGLGSWPGLGLGDEMIPDGLLTLCRVALGMYSEYLTAESSRVFTSVVHEKKQGYFVPSDDAAVAVAAAVRGAPTRCAQSQSRCLLVNDRTKRGPCIVDYLYSLTSSLLVCMWDPAEGAHANNVVANFPIDPRRFERASMPCRDPSPYASCDNGMVYLWWWHKWRRDGKS
ncbi:uncharacterized protein LY79DRAFT_301917 [Colletotrichum navitas]|uniref:Uncharacterized protein n=1 Tax=Colletotrichum navitas TaxID=681940 RepID=A0AAD8V393_9PEZI|nr:uncharacterized protein LY79DRAFT_301917 [Colletotrichum navitas]KAK1580493.1 hypothetical protein LY79DRAFT_301917 [Colletotrichum navitas]